MITPWNIYWITRLDEISVAVGILAAVPFVGIIIALIGLLNASIELGIERDAKDRVVKRIKQVMICGTVLGFLTLLNAFIPSTKQMAAIVVIPKIANSETVCELGQGVKELALDWLKELKPNHGNEKKEAK